MPPTPGGQWFPCLGSNLQGSPVFIENPGHGVELEFFEGYLASCTPSRLPAYALAFLMGGPRVSRASPRAREVRAPLTPKNLKDHREK